MKNENEKVILYDSPEAAVLVPGVPVWRDVHGYLHTDEDFARSLSATHRKCAGCGELIKQSYELCNACINKKSDAEYDARYAALPRAQWDPEKCPVASWDGSQFFFEQECLDDCCANKGKTYADLYLVLCAPAHVADIDTDHWAEIADEYGDLPNELEEIIEDANERIRELNAKGAGVWQVTDVAVEQPKVLTKE